MKTPQKTLIRLLSFGLVATAVVAQTLFPITVSADQIASRRLTLEAGAAAGGSFPGGVVNHFFEFTLPSGTTPGGEDVGSIKFEYCTTAANSVDSPTCIAPSNVDATSATLSAQSGATGFTNMVDVSANEFYISRVAAANVPEDTPVSYRFSGVTNPDVEMTFFVRITTYSSTDATTGAIDSGTVAAATAEAIDLTGTMPESLVFCTGETVSTNVSGVPDCGTATPGDITFNKLFSPTDTAIATSQMAASTNAGAGYVVTVNGETLSSGSNEIDAISAAADTSRKGVSQFGLNLKENTVSASVSFPGDSAEVAPAANTANYRGQAAAGYATQDSFKYSDGDIVANSFNGSPGGTDAQIFTASYIVNVPGSQPAGTYTTTLTYICTPTF